MAKELVIAEPKKGVANFTLTGKAKVSDFTFSLDVPSKKEDSDWVYNQIKLGVDCGQDGVIYAELMGGYGSERDNVVYVHGKKKDDNGNMTDDFKNFYTIAWEDRLDEEVLEQVGEKCFITVGLEKDDKDNTVYKKFITPYDAIQYISEVLEDGMVVKVRGNLTYQEYDGKVTVKKEITSIALSKAEVDKFSATFMQTVFVENDSFGKPDKDTMTLPLDVWVVEYVKEYQGNKIFKKGENGKEKQGMNLPLAKHLEIEIDPEKPNLIKGYVKWLKPKKNKVTRAILEGKFTKGQLETVETTEEDYPDDIKELIDLGLYTEEELCNKKAFASGNKTPERMVVIRPQVKCTKKDDGNIITSLQVESDIFEEDEINPLMIIDTIGRMEESVAEETKDEEEDISSTEENENVEETETSDDLDAVLNGDWLNDLN